MEGGGVFFRNGRGIFVAWRGVAWMGIERNASAAGRGGWIGLDWMDGSLQLLSVRKRRVGDGKRRGEIIIMIQERKGKAEAVLPPTANPPNH